MRRGNRMKLGIIAFILWAVCMAVLLALDIESFKLGFFALMLTIAILVAFALKAFLTSGSDH